ncbi:MAG TPA: hypothetical protein DCZ63_11455 [Geobacter sp.]|nr:hypothetical protein [Geobacter sp.]
MLKTLLQDKTTALIAIVAMICGTALVIFGKLAVNEDMILKALAFVFGGPLVSSGLNKIYNSTPSEPPAQP